VFYAFTPSLFHPTVIWLSIRTRTKIMLIRTREAKKFMGWVLSENARKIPF
jgi:hypothetical protein